MLLLLCPAWDAGLSHFSYHKIKVTLLLCIIQAAQL
jgi:hypothetical protein